MTLGAPAHVTYDRNGDPKVRTLRRLEIRSASVGGIKERVLQTIIDEHPDVLPLNEFFPAANTVCSLGREIPVELAERAGERQGYIDNLLVTDDGHLVLVETKLWRNPEAVRQVIAQVMEYSMAIGGLGLLELEKAIRQGDPRSCRLAQMETVADRIRETAAARGATPVLDDFEDAFARFRQSGELLVLIVADGIQTSVERLARWFDYQFAPGSPLRLGLVELRFYDDENGHMVVPVTLMRTKELGRHTVLIQVKEGPASSVAVSVRDVVQGHRSASRQVGKTDTPMTKETFLVRARSTLSGEQLATVEMIVFGLDQLGLATKGSPTSWQYGVNDGSAFLGLAALGDRYLWCQIPSRLRALLGDERFVECKRLLNNVAPFYRPEDAADPDKVNALTPKYDVVVGKEEEFVKAIGAIAEMARARITEHAN